MIVAGAGGHATEVFESLTRKYPGIRPAFFSEEKKFNPLLPENLSLIYSAEELSQFLDKDPAFCLGVGHPLFRERLGGLMESLGGKLNTIRDPTSIVSLNVQGEFDAMAFCYVGPDSVLGKGVLVNVRANVHHDSRIGDYTEIGPGALILGNVRIGKKCRIGAGAVILPGVTLGDEVVVGAGAVVTRNVPVSQVVIGIPAKPKI
jgi:sugar O-acyltransferase (sialic acid O-acetyltransferase NeuD family)